MLADMRRVFKDHPTRRYSLRQLAGELGKTERIDILGINARLRKLTKRSFVVQERATIGGVVRMVYRLRLPSDA